MRDGIAPSVQSGVPRSYVLPALRFGAVPPHVVEERVQAFEKSFRAKTGFELDPFQRQSIRILAEGKSPVVAAPTSSGKTLVAEAAIEDAIRNRKSIFYTTPRKAISNEKYHEFCEKYGKENVGLVTGDVSVNPEAPLVLMTTEIFRNMLYQPTENADRLKRLKYAVFDECHFINDAERGPVWEESAIYARRELPNVQQIHLSATIQNAQEYTDWLNSLNKAKTQAGQFELVTSAQRPVPLSVQYMTPSGNLLDILNERDELSVPFKKAFKNTTRSSAGKSARGGNTRGAERGQGRPASGAFDPVLTVAALGRAGRLPAIEFVFSRERCRLYAEQVMNAGLNLVTSFERKAIARIIQAYQDTYPSMEGSRLIPFLMEGVAYHHADMWPREKELVEVLLKKGLLKAVFATSTLAEGVNVPAQTVGLTSYVVGQEPITTSEYQQMTGRAGRRGMFEHGYAVLSHPPNNDVREIERLVRSEPNKVSGHFRVTPYMALNHLDRIRDISRIYDLLDASLYSYQIQQERQQQVASAGNRRRQKKVMAEISQQTSPLKEEFKAMRRYLHASGFVNSDDSLTPLGQLAGEIPMESSLMVARAVRERVLDKLNPVQLASVLSAAVSEDMAPGQELGRDITLVSADPEVGEVLGALSKIEKSLTGVADQYGVSTGIKLGAAHINTVARWCRTHDRGVLEESPGVLTYNILRTSNLLLHILESELTSPALRETAKEARELLLGGIIEEQIRPKKVEVD